VFNSENGSCYVMSDTDLIGGGIVGGMIGYQSGFNKGRQQGYSEGYKQANWEKEREITSLHNEIMNLKEQIRKL